MSTKTIIKLFGTIVFFLAIEGMMDKGLIYFVFSKLGREDLIGNILPTYWLAVAVGSIPAGIDCHKGKSFFTWWIYWALVSLMAADILYAFWDMAKILIAVNF
jgi:hypothetical protein